MLRRYLLTLSLLAALFVPPSTSLGATVIVDSYQYSSAITCDPATYGTVSAWYDASDTSSITSSSGAVSQWNDKSGNGRNLTQGTGGSQPLDNTRTVNGRVAIDFDGSDDFMTFPSGMYGFHNSSSNTVFIVAANDTPTADHALIGGQVSTTIVMSMQTRSIGPGVRFRAFSSGSNSVDVTTTVGTGTRIWAYKKDSGTLRAYLDGNVLGTNSSGQATLTLLELGRFNAFPTQVWDGPIAEASFLTTLSTADMNSYGACLAAKWGTTWNTIP